MSFLTCFWLLPQNEHLSRSPPSPMRATRRSFRSVLLSTSPVRTPPAQLSLPCCCSALSRVDATCSCRPTLLLNAGVASSSPSFRRGRTRCRHGRTRLHHSRTHVCHERTRRHQESLEALRLISTSSMRPYSCLLY